MILATHYALLAAGVVAIVFMSWKRDPITLLTVLIGVAVAVIIEYRNDGFYPAPPLFYVAPRLWVLPASNIPVSMMAYVGTILMICAVFGGRLRRLLVSRGIRRWPLALPVRILAQILVSFALAAFFEYGFAYLGLLVWRLNDPGLGPLLGTATAASVCLVSYAVALAVVRLAKFTVRKTNPAP